MHYTGNELALFSTAKNWKKYFAGFILPHVKGRVLEVGAGLGTITPYLRIEYHSEWVLLEPDEDMANSLKSHFSTQSTDGLCTIINGSIEDLNTELFDTILYIDVLEHIADDSAELLHAANLLREGGKVIVLSPAYQCLFSPFDKAIGHYRRYSKKSLLSTAPATLTPILANYLDSIGFFLSLANRIILQQRYPRQSQINFWDRMLVPVAVVMDRLFLFGFGRSVLLIWTKQTAA